MVRDQGDLGQVVVRDPQSATDNRVGLEVLDESASPRLGGGPVAFDFRESGVLVGGVASSHTRDVRPHIGVARPDRTTDRRSAPPSRAAIGDPWSQYATRGRPNTTAAKLLVAVGDNPQRIRSEAAFAHLCGVAPIPASSGKTIRHRLNRGGYRQANSAPFHIVLTRMKHHQPTRDYVARRLAEGKTMGEIARILRRYVAREVRKHLSQPT